MSVLHQSVVDYPAFWSWHLPVLISHRLALIFTLTSCGHHNFHLTVNHNMSYFLRDRSAT